MGQAKTNLLEALSFLTPGRGLRGAALAEVGYRPTPHAPPSPTWGVAARLALGVRGAAEVGTGREVAAGERRLVRIDGRSAAGQAALGALMPVLWLTPDLDGLFRGAASDRRRFLDRLVNALDPEHAGRAAAYARAQRDRLRLLRQGGAVPAWLDALEDVMARQGVAVVAARAQLLDLLGETAAAGAGPFPGVRVDLVSEIAGWLAHEPALGWKSACAGPWPPAGAPMRRAGPRARALIAMTGRPATRPPGSRRATARQASKRPC
ncbi:DNA replication and repair protein RecF [Pararhodospirillum photometricum]|uniref:DNA replication and repair protein RecF n=1 Tax=Pararhodospirillum photometricum DSM 122 TaxID=1150469 RepID=H6SQY9_PARPM|nr:DNA replication and repair protein RecF [Pararhodospirillum photometricum]CCG07454.1 DNA replication and repair protein recF [Pararhodospirillum photometricum DSM 122]